MITDFSDKGNFGGNTVNKSDKLKQINVQRSPLYFMFICSE